MLCACLSLRVFFLILFRSNPIISPCQYEIATLTSFARNDSRRKGVIANTLSYSLMKQSYLLTNKTNSTICSLSTLSFFLYPCHYRFTHYAIRSTPYSLISTEAISQSLRVNMRLPRSLRSLAMTVEERVSLRVTKWSLS